MLKTSDDRTQSYVYQVEDAVNDIETGNVGGDGVHVERLNESHADVDEQNRSCFWRSSAVY